jgi:hypothetical protein
VGREELLRPEPVILSHGAQNILTTHLAPGNHLVPPRQSTPSGCLFYRAQAVADPGQFVRLAGYPRQNLGSTHWRGQRCTRQQLGDPNPG